MLAEFLKDAAIAYAATGDEAAQQIATGLLGLKVPDNWQVDGPPPSKQSLEMALAASDRHQSVRHLAQIANHLEWVDAAYFRTPPAGFRGSYCFTRIAGPDSLIEAEDFRFGVYLQDAHTIYPSHKHAAEELYFPLSGTALWQKDDGPFDEVASGTLIHHLTYQPHATTTFEAPMLAFWAWLGDLDHDTYSFVNE